MVLNHAFFVLTGKYAACKIINVLIQLKRPYQTEREQGKSLLSFLFSGVPNDSEPNS